MNTVMTSATRANLAQALLNAGVQYLPTTGGTISGNLTVASGLTVSGTTTLQRTVVSGYLSSYNGSSLVNPTMYNPVALNGLNTDRLTASGLITTSGLTVQNNAIISGGLNVSGTTTLNSLSVASETDTGNLTVGGNLTVTGTSTLIGNATFSGNANVSGTLTVSGLITTNGLTVQNNAIISGGLTVSGTTTLNSLSVANEVDTGNLTVGGNLTVSGTITSINPMAYGNPNVGETFSRYIATVANTVSSTVMRFGGVYLTAGQVVNNITFATTSVASSGLTSSWGGIFTTSGTTTSMYLLAATSGQVNPTYAATSTITTALSGPFTVPSNGIYLVGFAFFGTTPPGWAGTGNAANAVLGAQFPVIMAQISVSSYPTPPAIGKSFSVGGSSYAPWFALT